MTITREEALNIYNSVAAVTVGNYVTPDFVQACITAAHNIGYELGRKQQRESDADIAKDDDMDILADAIRNNTGDLT